MSDKIEPRQDKKEDKNYTSDAALATKVRKMEAEVHKLTHFKDKVLAFMAGMGFTHSDGNSKIGILVSLAVVTCAGLILAETISQSMFDAGTYGNATFSGNSSTVKASLTVDSLTVNDNLTTDGDILKGDAAGVFEGFKVDGDMDDQFTASDDFLNADVLANTTLNGYVVATNIVGGTLDVTGVGGVLVIQPTTNVLQTSYGIQWGDDSGMAPFYIDADSGKKFAFEARVKAGDTNSVDAGFVGLIYNGTTAAQELGLILDNTGNLLTNVSYVGFLSRSDRWSFVTCNLVTNSVQQNVAVATSAEAYINLGFAFDGTQTVTIYANGTALGTTVTWTNTTCPDVTTLTPFFMTKVLTNNTMTDAAQGSLYVDYWKASQDR